MSKNVVETLTGAAVLIVAIGFGVFAYNKSNLKPVDGYALKARFANVDGIGGGSDVRIGGIKVGVVAEMDLDPETYEALVTLQLKDGVPVPEDSSAGIVSSGLLGSKYVAITPGGMDEILNDGDEIAFTQSSVNIETLIGKMVHSGGGVEEGAAPAAAPDSAAPASNSGSGLFE